MIEQRHLDLAGAMVRALWPRPDGIPRRLLFLFSTQVWNAAAYLAWLDEKALTP